MTASRSGAAALNLKYLNIWYAGDDSFDLDCGYRGKAQFGLTVQGYCLSNSQGGGICDKCFEMDGAEGCDAQPCSAVCIYNWTAIGQPHDNTHQATSWRDNMHAQFRNCIWIDVGGQLVSKETTGETASNSYVTGTQGFGVNGTLGWPACWFTPASYQEPVYQVPGYTPGGISDPTVLYQSQQSDGYLCEIRNSIFYHFVMTGAFTEANNCGVFDPAMNNTIGSSLPIQSLIRDANVVVGSGANAENIEQMLHLDPRDQ